jgi:hypothetical protein
MRTRGWEGCECAREAMRAMSTMRRVGFVGDSIQMSCKWYEKVAQRQALGEGRRHTDLCIVADCQYEGIVVGRLQVHESGLEPLILRCDACHVAESPAIDVIDADDVCVGAKGLQDGGCGR